MSFTCFYTLCKYNHKVNTVFYLASLSKHSICENDCAVSYIVISSFSLLCVIPMVSTSMAIEVPDDTFSFAH